ncbi:MAG: hypothetical protein WBX27_10540 [Specibacter sp.]
MIARASTILAGRPRRVAAWAAASGLGALLLSGCTAEALVSHYTPGPASLQGRVDCLASPQWRAGYGPIEPAAALMGSVPQGFKAVDVVECRRQWGQTAGSTGTAGRMVVERHLGGDYAALLAALAESSDRQETRSCTSEWVEIPDLWLVNSDAKAVHVKWPLDVCSKPKPGTAKALDGLPAKSTKTLPLAAEPQ